MRLFIIRHAQSMGNIREGEIPNCFLSELGKKQAETIPMFFQKETIDHIYSSPLRRTIQTATPLADEKGMEITLVPRMSEIFNEEWTDYRDYDWESCEQILEEFPNTSFSNQQNLDQPWWPTWPESNRDVVKRVEKFYQSLLQVHGESRKTIVVFGHWASAAALQKMIDKNADPKLANASIFECEVNTVNQKVEGILHLNHLGTQLTY